MESKKSPEADLEKRKRSFLFTGLMIALAIVLVGMEWTIFDRQDSELGDLNADFMEEEVAPISTAPPPPPPPPPAPSTVVEIVEDEEDIEETEQVFEEPDEDTEVVEIVEVEEEEETDEIFTIVEDMPAFPGGEAALFKFLGKNLNYPAMAQDAGISGTVYVNFVVDRDGKVKNARIARGIHSACDKEALRVVNSMPAWIPGKQRGKKVKVSYNLPIKYTLK